MAYDYSKLKSKMVEKGYNQETLAKAINMGVNSLSNKLNNRYPFKSQDMADICRVLDINPIDIGIYFFSK
jgi:DNA-binding Xre family transcriptional regulator